MSLAALGACLAASAALAGSARALARWLRPATATILLTVTGLAAALATGFVACVVAFDAVAQWPLVAAVGGWNAGAVHRLDPGAGQAFGVFAGIGVSVLLARSLLTGAGELAALWRSTRACRRMPHTGGLVVTKDTYTACALAGFQGRILVGAPLLTMLTRRTGAPCWPTNGHTSPGVTTPTSSWFSLRSPPTRCCGRYGPRPA